MLSMKLSMPRILIFRTFLVVNHKYHHWTLMQFYKAYSVHHSVYLLIEVSNNPALNNKRTIMAHLAEIIDLNLLDDRIIRINNNNDNSNNRIQEPSALGLIRRHHSHSHMVRVVLVVVCSLAVKVHNNKRKCKISMICFNNSFNKH